MRLGHALERRTPGARLEVFPAAGHNLHQERPELVNPMLVDFLHAST